MEPDSSGKRINFRLPVQYERILEGGEYDIPVTVPGRDLRLEGVSFYSQEKMSLNCKLRITISVAERERVSFRGKVVRIEMSDSIEEFYRQGLIEITYLEEDK